MPTIRNPDCRIHTYFNIYINKAVAGFVFTGKMYQKAAGARERHPLVIIF